MGNSASATKSLLSVVLGCGEHETVIGRHLADTFGPSIKLIFVSETDLGFDEELVLLIFDEFGYGEYSVVDLELLLVGGVVCGSGGFGSHEVSISILINFKFYYIFS